ncbi:carbohydrate ABC transporter permease [Streptomyces cellulosae]|uniref:carbohydrate ABC transporter permease n=1 Tax=Streptomyces cellulosae TaxID=1968 RepID=UPI0007C68896|nr:sugar ABC transporter permease [Streptomyces cellulosae]
MRTTASSRPVVTGRGTGVGPWLAVPGLALLVVFVFRPLVRTLQLSTYASDLIGNPTRFVGLDNYVSLLTDSDFLHTVTISIVIALLGMVLATVGALCAALLLRRRLLGGGIFNLIFSLPFAYSAASASAVFAGLFAPSVGVLNIILGEFGVGGPHWLADPVTAVWSIAIATAWYEFGFAFLVLTAAVRDVPPEVVEAAQMDGAGGFRLAARILVPIMRPSILFLVVTQTITGLQSFAQIQVLTRGGPAGATTTLVYRLYQLAFGNGTPDFGRASVIAIILILIVTAITALQFRLFGREKTA